MSHSPDPSSARDIPLPRATRAHHVTRQSAAARCANLQHCNFSRPLSSCPYYGRAVVAAGAILKAIPARSGVPSPGEGGGRGGAGEMGSTRLTGRER